VISVVYSLDLHALSHTFETSSADDSDHCELCIINHQKEQSQVALEPQLEDFEITPLNIQEELQQLVVAQQFYIHSNYYSGQFYNRPPPFTI